MATSDLSILQERIISQLKRQKVLQNAIDQINRQYPVGTTARTTKRMRIQEPYAQGPALESHIRDSLEIYSKTACRQLCENAVRILPRELRDLISDFLVTPDVIYAGPQYLTKEGRPCENDRDVHFWDKEYVGETMSLELIQNWYRLSLFYFWDKTRNADVIERFMALDRWGRGIKPNEHISRVRFDLGDGIFHRNVSWPHLAYPGHGANCNQEGYSSRLVAPLKTMSRLRMPQRVRFLIRIHTLGSLEWNCMDGENLRATLKDLLSELKALRSVGHRFTVQWSEVGNLEFTSSDSIITVDAWKNAIEEAVKNLPERQ